MNQGLAVVKVPPAFCESNRRCYAICSLSPPLSPSHSEMSMLEKSVFQPSDWDSYMKRSLLWQEALCYTPLHSVLLTLLPGRLASHLVSSLLPLLGSGM